MGSRHIILGMAVMAVGTAAYAGPVSWTYNGGTAASNSWGSGTSWSPASPAFDGSEDVTFSTATISANRTLTLDGDRVINSLSATSGNGFKYTVNPGFGGAITLLSGNLSLDGGGQSYGRPVALTNTTLQIGDGVTPVTTAIFNFNNSHATNRNPMEIGALKGMTGTVVSLQGNNLGLFAGNSSAFLGTFRHEQYNATASSIRLQLAANNALGGEGSKLVLNSTIGASVGTDNVYFNPNASNTVANSTSHEMDLQVDVLSGLQVGMGSGYTTTTPYSTATLNGNLSGAGNMEVGVSIGLGSVFAYGRLVVNGENNTASGNVALKGGRLQVDGTWTGAGNFTVSRGLLTGTGSIGLFAGRNVSLAATGTYSSADPYSVVAGIAPGDTGIVGTLTIGTLGNSNTVAFNNSSGASGGFDRLTQFIVDIDGLAADRLNVNGDVTLGNTQVRLVLNELSTPLAAQYVLLSSTGSLTGTFVSVSGLPDGYELQYTSNQLLLVNPSIPEPTSIAGLALLGGMLVRRRRSL